MVPRFLVWLRFETEKNRSDSKTTDKKNPSSLVSVATKQMFVTRLVQGSNPWPRNLGLSRSARVVRTMEDDNFFYLWNWTPRNGLYLPIAIKKNFLLWFTALLTFGYSFSLFLRRGAREREAAPFPGMERAWEPKSHNGWWTGLPRAIEKRAEGPLVIFTATIFI